MAAPTPPPVPAGVVQSSFYAAAPTAPAQPAYPPAPVHNQPQSFTPVPPAQGQRPFDAAIPLDERPSDFYSQTVLAAATRAQPTSFYDPRSRPVMRDVTAELPKRSAVIKTVDLTAKGNLQSM